MNTLKYYIIPSDKIEDLKPLMIESLKTQNIYVRMSLDATLGIMIFTEELAPVEYQGYTKAEMSEIVSGPDWTNNEELN
jgi:hypothetical protein